MIFVGIDVGLKGGVVAINEHQLIQYKHVMPVIKINNKNEYNVKLIVEIFKEIIKLDTMENIFVILEKEHVRPISGKRASFLLGYGYGGMQFLLESFGVSYEIVSPQAWMKELGITSKDTKGSIVYCQRKWPSINWCGTDRSRKPHDGLTDAACMALYGYRKNR